MPAPTRIRDRLAGRHILLTGSTGFLAKAVLERLLRSVDTLASVTLLVRSRPDGHTAARRVRREVLGSPAFDRLRALLGDRFDEICREKIHVVEGDLSREKLGIDPANYKALCERITLVVNSAATVTFDEELDKAVELNTMGPARLLQFARDCGDVPFMHVSTCYVAGDRTGGVPEDFSAPPLAEKKLPRVADSDAFDIDGLIEDLRSRAAGLRERFGPDTEESRRALIEAGMDAAHQYGWHDTYTFTKWIGEQLLRRDHGTVPLVVFRPAIIESSYEEPAPGWIDGLRMADPIIVAYGRGKITEFPAAPDVPIDFIPVDVVVSAMLATMPTGASDEPTLRVYHCGSSARNPLMLRELVAWVREAYRLRPMNDEEGRPIEVGLLRIVSRDAFLARWGRRLRLITRWRSILLTINKRSRRARRLAVTIRQIEQLIYFAKIYSPYTHYDCRFLDDSLRAVAEGMHPDDRAEFNLDIEDVNWHDYLVNRHVPGLRSFVLGTGFEPSRRMVGREADPTSPSAEADSFRGDHLFDVFRRAAERFGDKPALQVRRNNRWIRYTYDETLQASGAVMKRLLERGIVAGERIAICADNGPEWGIVYLGVMRAGCTAVPLDPQLPSSEVWAAARFVDARLMCASASKLRELQEQRGEEDCPIVDMRGPFVPPPGASRDPAPDPEVVDDTAVASILFTSGTTVAPKAVQLTHRNFIANGSALLRVHPIDPADEFLSVLPMYHAFEFTGGFLVPLANGATITYIDQLKGPEIVAAMKATGTTVMLVVPRLLQMFHDSILNRIASSGAAAQTVMKLMRLVSGLTGHRFARKIFGKVHAGFGGRLRMFVSGASRLDPDVLISFQRLGFTVCEGYGLTETSPVVAVNPPSDVRPGSVGRPLPNVEVEIRGANLEEIGEIWVRGPSITPGYLKNDQATREIIEDGWLRTGDLGRVDQEGFLFITGRSKDLIVTSAGKNVYPDEVEFAYKELPFVKEFCVLAMPMRREAGDAVHAVVVVDREAAPHTDRSSLDREIRSAAAAIGDSLPTHQRIAAFHFWDRELPRTSTMKAKRTVIREMLLAEGQRASDPAHAEDASVDAEGRADIDENSPASKAVLSILARQSGRPVPNIAPAMNLLLDLGIDSIGRIDVIGQIEGTFDMRIDNDRAAGLARVMDLLLLVRDRTPKTAALKNPTAWRRHVADDGQAAAINGKPSAALLPARWAVRGAAGVFMHTYVRVRVEGREHIPEAGAFILAPNHTSHLDSPAVITAVGGTRRVWIAGAEDYFFNSAMKRMLFGGILDTIPFDRRADGMQGLRRCGEALARGDGLILFPEGTRSLTGMLQPFKLGVAVLALERRVPIVPVHIHRAYDLFRKGQRFVRPGAVTVTFCPPIHPPDPEAVVDHYEAFQQMTEQLQASVAKAAKGVA